MLVVLSHLTFRSPPMMDRLRKLWEIIDINNISIRALYSIRGESLGRKARPKTGKDDMQLNSRIFIYPNSLWDPHSIDGFAT
jgi:hypothetical protein